MTRRVARVISGCGLLAVALAVRGNFTPGWGWTIASLIPLGVAAVLIALNRPGHD